MTQAIVALCLLLAAGTAHQEHPNFAGTWKPVPGSVGTGRANRGGPDSLQLGRFPIAMVIAQDAATLTVDEEYAAGNGLIGYSAPHTTFAYPLDGRTQPNDVPIQREQITAEHTTAPAEFTCLWEGGQLVATVRVSVPGEAVPRRYQRRIWLESDGTLVVQVLRISTPHSMTDRYRRVSQIR
jgi:hypothetical protein